MEGVGAASKVSLSFDSKSKPSKGATKHQNTIPTPSVPASQSFEWVQHGDATARRRARAHVTRGFRRQKAEQAQLEKAKSESKSPSPPSDEPDDVVTVYENTPPVVQPYKEDDAKNTFQDIVLVRTLGSGRTDPFTSLPVKLNAETQALLDHFVFGVAPVSFALDSSSDFNPVKALSFNVALADPSAFHVLLAAGASDIAALHGRQDSEDAIKHRGMSITLVNRRLSLGDASDRALAAVSLLAGNELLFGTPQGYNTHMNGLVELLRIRGGIETLQETNPPLYSWISWIDYAGSCNLISRRRFTPNGPVANSDISNPGGVPRELIRSIPVGYDLFEHAMTLFRRFEIMVACLRAGETQGQQVMEVSKFLSQIDQELYRSICRPDTVGTKSRRQYVHQCFHLYTLMHGAMVSASGGPDVDLFLERTRLVFKGESRGLGYVLSNLCRVCVNGIAVNSDALNIRISLLVEGCGNLGWREWWLLKKELLKFFLTEEVCAGQLQNLWRTRIGAMSVPFRT